MNRGSLVLIRISLILLSQHFGLTQLTHRSVEAVICVYVCIHCEILIPKRKVESM